MAASLRSSALLLLVGCGSDGPLLLSGTACSTSVRYELTGDETNYVVFDTTGNLTAVAVMDGPSFDTQLEAEWKSYAKQYDTVLLLAFDDPEPATPHTVTKIFDSNFGGRGTGTMGFVEHGNGESVEIRAIDTAAKTIDIAFTIPVAGFTPSYPPVFASIDRCAAGSVSGSFSGPYEILAF